MKERYESPEVEVISFNTEDILTASDENEGEVIIGGN